MTDQPTEATRDGASPVPLPDPLPYRLISGPDDTAFCERVSAALATGYRLHGTPSVATDAQGRVVVAQAVVLAAAVDERGELR